MQVHECARVDGGAFGLCFLHLLNHLGILRSDKSEGLLKQGVGLLTGAGRERCVVVCERAQAGQFHADEARHQFAATHSREPREASIGLLALA